MYICDSKDMGKVCKFLRHKAGYTQKDVANDTNYSITNISAFECGRNNNVWIFLWYLTHTSLSVDKDTEKYNFTYRKDYNNENT